MTGYAAHNERRETTQENCAEDAIDEAEENIEQRVDVPLNAYVRKLRRVSLSALSSPEASDMLREKKKQFVSGVCDSQKHVLLVAAAQPLRLAQAEKESEK